MKSRPLLFAILSCLSLTACVTAEYQQAANQCRNQALQSYPVVMEQRIFRRSREVMVPDGSTICETSESQSSMKNTNMTRTTSVCRPGMRSAVEYYDEPGMVDVNADGRERYVSDCAASQCLQRFGNARCKH